MKLTQERQKKNPLQTRNDDYNRTYSDKDNDNLEVEEEEEEYQRNNFGSANENKKKQKLDFFNVNDFFELDLDSEAKCLLKLMKKFSPNRDILP